MKLRYGLEGPYRRVDRGCHRACVLEGMLYQQELCRVGLTQCPLFSAHAHDSEKPEDLEHVEYIFIYI